MAGDRQMPDSDLGQRPNASGDRILILDGLRGIAVILVLFAHFFPNLNYAPSRILAWTNNFAMSGWVGVDLFFVLSGFLITGILLGTRGRPDYFRNFYIRRALRIFPLYYGALLIVYGLLPLAGVLTPVDLGRVWELQAWNWAHCSNVAMGLDPNHLYNERVNFSHFWSLAVEEHFYLAWPVVVWLTPTRRLGTVCVGIVLFAVAVRSVAEFGFAAPNWFFKQTPCRIDSLAVGGLLAVAARSGRLGEYRVRMALVAGLIGVGLVVLFVNLRCLAVHHWLTRSVGFTVLAVFFASVIGLAVTVRPSSRTWRLLANPVLCFFGTYSYGIYVIHGMLTPVLGAWTPAEEWIAATGSPALGSFGVFAVRVAISVTLAVVSWHLYEKQFLKLKRHFEYTPSPTAAKHPPLSEPVADIEQDSPVARWEPVVPLSVRREEHGP